MGVSVHGGDVNDLTLPVLQITSQTHCSEIRIPPLQKKKDARTEADERLEKHCTKFGKDLTNLFQIYRSQSQTVPVQFCSTMKRLNELADSVNRQDVSFEELHRVLDVACELIYAEQNRASASKK